LGFVREEWENTLKSTEVDRSILFKFSLETRQESESFEPLVAFLVFMVRLLWPENNKMINFLIMVLIILFFLGHNFST